MNDMSAPIVAVQEIAGFPASFTMNDAHILRSKIIGKCADVECWLVDRIQPYQTPSPSFSVKVKQFEEILAKHKEAFNNPTKIQSYLKEFQPFAIFRSELAHAKLSLIETAGNISLIAIQNAAWGSNVRTAKSIVLSSEELERIWNETHVAAQKITNYTTTLATTVTPAKAGA
ncbi:hypothetical protein [Parasphingorhabdus sp.]|uniref:hypothetical protein n=1 Tax=Parasphingorhabdus sp. TaxID=2709688 RepID=UPI0032ECE86D